MTTGDVSTTPNSLAAPSHLLLAFVDESYTDNHFFLGTVVVDGAAARRIESEFDAILTSYENRFGIGRDTELHGYPLFHGEGEWNDAPTRVRVNVYSRAMRAIAGSGARIILRGMDTRQQRLRYVDPWPPHEVVLTHTLERLNDFASSLENWVLVLADEVHNDERHRTNFREFRRRGTPGYRSSTLPHLLDTIHFGPSCHSRCLQAADLVTFLHRRRRTHPEPDLRARTINDELWRSVECAIAHEHYWRP